MFEAGRLRHRVDFEKLVRQTDPATGDVRMVWSPVATNVAAAVEPLSVKEYIAAQATQSEIVARIVIRYRPGLSPSQRAVHRTKRGTTFYNVTGLLPDRDSGEEYITIPAATGTNDG